MAGKSGHKRASRAAQAQNAAAAAASLPSTGAAPTAALASPEPADPRWRLQGKIALVCAWAYVAALWLLALDQTFGWGVFGSAIPPTP